MSDPKRPDKPTGDDLSEPTMIGQSLDPGIAELSRSLPHDGMVQMQAVLARCEVVHVAPSLQGFNFRGFVHNLRGLGKIEVEGVKLFTLLTRNNAFLLTNLVAEELHDLIRGFMDLQLGDRITLRDGSKYRYLYKLPSQQIERLRTIVNQNRLITAGGFPFSDLEQFKKRLLSCSCDTPSFDVPAFAATVRFVSNVYEDREGNQYHHVVAGDPEQTYVLYVAPRTPPGSGVALSFGNTRLLLVHE